jgi:predicted ATP-dependent protease
LSIASARSRWAGRFIPGECSSFPIIPAHALHSTTHCPLSASLVFEQSCAGVEGDSATSAVLYTLLSALAGVPLSQSLAVTVSVNQHGEI